MEAVFYFGKARDLREGHCVIVSVSRFCSAFQVLHVCISEIWDKSNTDDRSYSGKTSFSSPAVLTLT